MSLPNPSFFEDNETEAPRNSPSPTSDDYDDDEEQGTPDDSSVEEVPESEFPAYFEERNGRLYHHSELLPYPLPVDTPEQQRQTVNHKVLNRIIRGNYQGPADAVLALNHARQPRALDMCTGNGKWVLDMAIEFPHAQFIGFDVVPIATRYPPPTVQFEICDVNSPLRWNDSYFDLIHARDILMGVPNYAFVLDEAARLLRPGGLFLSVEWANHITFHPDFEHLNVEDHAPASVRFFDAINHILLQRGVWMDGADVSNMIANSVHFTNVDSEQIFVPVGTWHETQVMRTIGSSFRAGHRKLVGAFKEMLLAAQMPPLEVDTLVQEYLEELGSLDGLVSIAYVTNAERV